ncbi:glycine-rich domain-containing protein [Amycolatopsis sp. lyj-109]|uniref:glycine-rich domain-containing protein n=1 Tax=Amycolatopsis sp. lyj-109 TaxID=2789287 RepID=UPI00397B25CE
MTMISAHLRSRDLVADDLFGRLVSRIAAEEVITRELAERIMDQALAFLYACAGNRGERLAPSSAVDIGWHTFLLYTKEYEDFCRRVSGRFIHHVPDDGRAQDGHGDEMARTVAAIAATGLAVDPELWLALAAQCNDGDDGCRASGKDGNENTDTNGK